jgi:predicted Fe-S protein YdhL (DUF1289 family)
MKKLIICTLLLAPAPAMAAGKTSIKSPTDTICRTINETGSRLGSKRICLTRAEWAEQKRTQRQDLERAQRNPLPPGGN